MRRERLYVRVADYQKVEWEACATELGVDLSELVRRAVDDYVLVCTQKDARIEMEEER